MGQSDSVKLQKNSGVNKQDSLANNLQSSIRSRLETPEQSTKDYRSKNYQEIDINNYNSSKILNEFLTQNDRDYINSLDQSQKNLEENQIIHNFIHYQNDQLKGDFHEKHILKIVEMYLTEIVKKMMHNRQDPLEKLVHLCAKYQVELELVKKKQENIDNMKRFVENKNDECNKLKQQIEISHHDFILHIFDKKLQFFNKNIINKYKLQFRYFFMIKVLQFFNKNCSKRGNP